MTNICIVCKKKVEDKTKSTHSGFCKLYLQYGIIGDGGSKSLTEKGKEMLAKFESNHIV